MKWFLLQVVILVLALLTQGYYALVFKICTVPMEQLLRTTKEQVPSLNNNNKDNDDSLLLERRRCLLKKMLTLGGMVALGGEETINSVMAMEEEPVECRNGALMAGTSF